MARRLGPKETPRRLKASERQARAVELHIEGKTFREIAVILDYASPSSVKYAIDGAIKKAPSAAVAELRFKIDARSQRLLEELMPIALGKKRKLDERLAAMDRIIRIDREQRQLHGLDAPAAMVQVTTEVASTDVRKELLDRLARLAAAAAPSEDPQPA